MKRNESDFVGFRWLGCNLSDVIHIFIIFLYDQGTFIRCNLLTHWHLAPIKGNPQIWTGSTSSTEILAKCHVSFWKKCLILISCLSLTKLLSMTYAKQNIQAAGSACSRLRVTWHGQKLAHHLRGNLRHLCQVSFSGLISWRLTTWNKKLGSRCHYAFAQGVPLRLALSPLGCGFERA